MFFKHSQLDILNLVINYFDDNKSFINDFYCGKKVWKQVVLINQSWISPILQKKWVLEFCFFSQKVGRGVRWGRETLVKGGCEALSISVCFLSPCL